MDNPNITMEEYIKLEEEKARWHGKVYNWETAMYGKICYNEDVHNLRSVETEFPAIIFNDKLSSEKTLSCEPTVSSLNNNKINFRISFDESDDEDYMVIFDKNSFSYKIIYANDLKTDSENNNEKVNMSSFPSPMPTVSCFDDLDFFKYFENEFPGIVYNDALTSKSNFLTEPTLSPQHIDEVDLKDETSLSECDEEEQNVLYFNDLFPFNIIYTDDLKSDKENDDNKIDIIQSSGGNEETQGFKRFLKASQDKINKIFIMKSFVMELDVNIMAWNYLNNGMLLNLIKNFYLVGLLLLVKVRRSLPYIFLHPNPWLNSNEDVIKHTCLFRRYGHVWYVKSLLEAVEKRFGGNDATKKTQRNILKQQYENFSAPSSETLDQTFDRLQNLVSQLEILGEKLSQEDVN
ncbi:hypothetical protein Tco_1218827 [Tanacetum coccineum]